MKSLSRAAAAIVAAALPLALLASPSAASADPGCALFGDRLTLSTNAPDDYVAVGIERSPTRLVINGGDGSSGGVLDCPGSPTVDNVKEIRMVDLSGGDTRHNIQNPDEFRVEGIDISSDLGTGEGDRMTIFGGPEGEMIHLGRRGLITSPSQSFDSPAITYAGVDSFEIQGGAGNDSLSGDPKDGEHRPVAQPLTLIAGPSEDSPGFGQDGETLVGGAGRDRIIGGLLNDTILGGAANDRIEAGAGSDYVKGGKGRDRIETGEGRDLLDAVDRTRDRRIDCGARLDRFRADRGLDPKPNSCERRYVPTR